MMYLFNSDIMSLYIAIIVLIELQSNYFELNSESNNRSNGILISIRIVQRKYKILDQMID